MAEKPRELDQRFQGGQFEAKFQAKGLLFAPLRHDTIYAYLPNHVNVYVSRILWHQKTRSLHSKCANSTPPTQTSQIIHLLVLTTTSEYRQAYLLILAVKRGRRFSKEVGLRLNCRLKGYWVRANIYGPLDTGMVVLQLCRWKFSHKETLQQTLVD